MVIRQYSLLILLAIAPIQTTGIVTSSMFYEKPQKPQIREISLNLYNLPYKVTKCLC